MTILETERLILRPFQESDIPVTMEALNDWDIQQWLIGPPYPYSEGDAQSWLELVQSEHKNGDAFRFALEIRETGAFIGSMGIERREGEGPKGPALDPEGLWLGYWLVKAAHGKGYATEAAARLVQYAFNTLSAPVVYCYADPDNAGSWNVMKKIGLEPGAEVEMRVSRRHDGPVKVRVHELRRS